MTLRRKINCCDTPVRLQFRGRRRQAAATAVCRHVLATVKPKNGTGRPTEDVTDENFLLPLDNGKFPLYTHSCTENPALKGSSRPLDER